MAHKELSLNIKQNLKKKVRQNSVTEILGNIPKLTIKQQEQNRNIRIGEFSGIWDVSDRRGGGGGKEICFFITRNTRISFHKAHL